MKTVVDHGQRRDPLLESTGIGITLTGTSKAAEPVTRDPRPFQLSAHHKCPHNWFEGGDTDAARCAG